MKLTKNEIVKELVKCGKDPQYFIDNYCKISHPMHGQIPFKTFDYQKDLLKDLQGSAMQKRDDRIYKNARPGSVLRKNMRKSGYTPPHLR